jgi:hypothetical protein
MSNDEDKRAELARLEAAFKEAGGRGVELADRIDALRAEVYGWEYGPHGEILTCESCGAAGEPLYRIPVDETRAAILQIDADVDIGAELCADCVEQATGVPPCPACGSVEEDCELDCSVRLENYPEEA